MAEIPQNLLRCGLLGLGLIGVLSMNSGPVAFGTTGTGNHVTPAKVAFPARSALKFPKRKLERPSPSPTPKPPSPVVFTGPAQFRGAVVYRAAVGNSKTIALTFDDGPSPETLKVLEILRQQKVKATFFCLGAMLREYPAIAKKVVQEGHAIGNHTWHHYYRDVDLRTAANEIDNTAVHIYRATGTKSLLFRPPGGRLKNGLADYAKKKNYVVVMWSIDPKDFQQPPAATLANTVISQAHAGGIVLLHDGGGRRQETLKALPILIKTLKQKGYQFLTVPELLALQASQKKETAGTPSN